MILRKKSLCTIACLALGVLASCSSNASAEFDTTKTITRYSRDTTSGTRDGFFTAIGYSEAKEDDTKIPGFVKADDNGNMISLVKNDEYGIGYISLASLFIKNFNKYETNEAGKALVKAGPKVK